MQPEEHPDPNRPPPSHNTGAALAGVWLIISGVLCGGGWTFLTYLGESLDGTTPWRGVPLATILTVVGTIAWIAAGVLLIVNAGQRMTGAGKNLGIPLALLAATAVGGYFFGFLACTAR
jgi:hypothetical protein